MSTIAIRDRLVYPAAVVLALGAVTLAPPTPGSPRYTEVSTIRLQAEVSSFVSGLADATVAGLASVPQAAASVTPAAASGSAVGDPWPSTFLDKLVNSLPPQFQSIILPPLYVVVTVVGAIMGVFYTVFGWPKDLMPAAAVALERPRGAAASVTPTEPVANQQDSNAASAKPGISAGADRTSVAPAVDAPAEPGGAPSGPTRGRHAETTAVADGSEAAKSPAPEIVPVASAAEAAPAAVAHEVAPVAVEADTLTPDVAVEQAPAATPAGNTAAPVTRPTRGRAASSGARSADAAPTQTVRRSAQ